MRRWFVTLGALLLLGPIGCTAVLIPAALGVGYGVGKETDVVVDHLKKDQKPAAEVQPQK
jgi:hypothetical protein